MEIIGGLHPPQLYHRRYRIWHPFDKKGKTRTDEDALWEEKTLQTVSGIEPQFLGHQAHNFVTIQTRIKQNRSLFP
jgi:hypothetical protein